MQQQLGTKRVSVGRSALGCERATHGASTRGWIAWRLTRAAADRSIVEVRNRGGRERRGPILAALLLSLRRVAHTGSRRHVSLSCSLCSSCMLT